jgi:hypothetical protein
MFEALPVSGWEMSGWGVVALFVLAILAGRLASRREVDAEKARADTWQHAWEASQAANREKDEALTELLQLGRTSARVLEHLQDASSEKRSEGAS